MDRTVDRTVIDRNTVPNLRKAYKIRWCTVITVPYRITVNRTVHRRVTTLRIMFVGSCPGSVGSLLSDRESSPSPQPMLSWCYTAGCVCSTACARMCVCVTLLVCVLHYLCMCVCYTACVCMCVTPLVFVCVFHRLCLCQVVHRAV